MKNTFLIIAFSVIGCCSTAQSKPDFISIGIWPNSLERYFPTIVIFPDSTNYHLYLNNYNGELGPTFANDYLTIDNKHFTDLRNNLFLFKFGGMSVLNRDTAGFRIIISSINNANDTLSYTFNRSEAILIYIINYMIYIYANERESGLTDIVMYLYEYLYLSPNKEVNRLPQHLR